jgi:hypothetical protein
MPGRLDGADVELVPGDESEVGAALDGAVSSPSRATFELEHQAFHFSCR